MGGPACTVHQLSYTCHPEIIMSDHRPVSADFIVDVSLAETYLEKRTVASDITSQTDVYDTEALQAGVRTLFNQVDDLQSERLRDRGELQIKDTHLDFEKISYVHYLSLGIRQA